MVKIDKDLLILLTSSAFGGLISMLISFYQWHFKSKHEVDEEERERLQSDVKYYHDKYRDDEDEIDRLKDEIREIKEADAKTRASFLDEEKNKDE